MGARVHDETRSSRATPRSADVALAVLYFGELRFQQAYDTRHEPALFFFFFFVFFFAHGRVAPVSAELSTELRSIRRQFVRSYRMSAASAPVAAWLTIGDVRDQKRRCGWPATMAECWL